MAVADAYAAFRSAQAAYSKAADQIDRALPSDLTRQALAAAGKALTAARHATQAARLVTEARSVFPPPVVEAALKAAGDAAMFAAKASAEAAAVAGVLVGEPMVTAGLRTREQAARIELAIDEVLDQHSEEQR